VRLGLGNGKVDNISENLLVHIWNERKMAEVIVNLRCRWLGHLEMIEFLSSCFLVNSSRLTQGMAP